MVKNSDIRSDNPNPYRLRTRSGLDVIGGATGCRRSARLSHHYGAAASDEQGTLKARGRQRQRRKKLPQVKEYRQRREITAQGTSKTTTEVKEYPQQRQITKQDVNEYRQRRGITVHGRNIPNPMRTFSDTGFPEYVIQEFSKAGFARPTPIQAQVWPIALDGRDLIGIAEPGSGKMLAYLIPAIAHVKSQPKLSKRDGPVVLVLAPTTSESELADQILQEYTKFCAASNIEALCGHPSVYEESRLKSGVGILITTPVVLRLMLEMGLTNLKRVTYLVLDGVDQILSMETEPEIRELVSQVHPDCQKLFLSATWPKEVDKVARPFLRNACRVEIGSPVLKATHSVYQIVGFVNEDQKYSKLVRLLGDIMGGSRILIFVDIKKGCESCDTMASWLRIDGMNADSVHEDKSQAERDRIVSEFQDGKIHIIIATDAGARDIDVKDVKYVINYDFPGSLDQYVYRIDHIGSAGAKGTAFTFFTAANARFAKALIILLKEAGQNVSPELAALGRDVPHKGRTVIQKNSRLEEANRRDKKIGTGRFYPIYLHCPEIENIATFAVDDINKKKEFQLHFVRVVEAYGYWDSTPLTKIYLTFEAADAIACAVNSYRAIVVKCGIRRSLETVLFGLVNLDGDLVKLIDTRMNLGYNVFSIWPQS